LRAVRRFRSLIGVSLTLGDDWAARLYVFAPRPGSRREQTARFALTLAKDISSVLYGQYRVRRIRAEAQAVERKRIARELHDGVTQSLLGLEMELVVMQRKALDRVPDLADDLVRAHRIVRNEIVAVRELMEGVRVGDETNDLIRHLSDVVDRFGRYTGIVAKFVSTIDGTPPFTSHVRREIARVVHEALVNVRKHSGAKRVEVRVGIEDGRWKLVIEDDGRGFAFAGRRSQEELDRTRTGPSTIAERVRGIGGMMAVESQPGRCTKLEVSLELQSV
jgi:two-component system nitrate/nitrite sensor histidine kinase NarX